MTDKRKTLQAQHSQAQQAAQVDVFEEEARGSHVKRKHKKYEKKKKLNSKHQLMAAAQAQWEDEWDGTQQSA